MAVVDVIKILLSLSAFIACFVLAQQLNKLPLFHFLSLRKNRYGAIDGLRGYLAFSVFIHHFVLTWYWKNTGQWERPPEAYFQNLGKFGIAIFFMITGFLFISKLLSSTKPIDWYRLYQSRVFRIYPLYLFAVLLMTVIVFYQSQLQMNVDGLTLFKQYFRWLIFHGDKINDYVETRRIIAGVDWTLKYEWLFYILLPLIAMLINKGRLAIFIVLIGLALLFIYPVRIEYFYTRYFILFAIGGLAVVLKSKLAGFEQWINAPLASIVVLLALVAAIFYPNTFSFLHVIFMSLFFIPIALGNTLFGLLKTKASIYLGEISYSIYLLHGAVLYVLFTLLNINIGTLSLVNTLMWLPLVGVLVLFVATATYLAIERPFMRFGKNNNLLMMLKRLTGR